MTAASGFILSTALLLLVILGILLPPLIRPPKHSSPTSLSETNLGIIRDQLRELERDLEEGSLAPGDFEQARTELQRRLLEEVKPEDVNSVNTGGRKTALALLITIPLAAATGYMLLGTPRALDPVNTQQRMTAQQIDGLLLKLAEKLKANPDDAKGWVMLARSYKALGRFDESAEAYSHAEALIDENPSLQADYAEVLLQTNGGHFDGKPAALISKALKTDPDEPQALFLAGAAAIDRKDFSSAIEYWGRLLLQLEPGSEEARSLGAAVSKAREMVSQAGTRNDQARSEKSGSKTRNPETISGEVSISDKISAQAKQGDVLFIFARTDEGSRMPIAVIRSQVANLPFSFRLDDSMALPNGQKLSEFVAVTLEARVARAGKAQSSSGDLFGSIKGVKPGSKNIKLVIDQVQP